MPIMGQILSWAWGVGSIWERSHQSPSLHRAAVPVKGSPVYDCDCGPAVGWQQDQALGTGAPFGIRGQSGQH